MKRNRETLVTIHLFRVPAVSSAKFSTQPLQQLCIFGLAVFGGSGQPHSLSRLGPCCWGGAGGGAGSSGARLIRLAFGPEQFGNGNDDTRVLVTALDGLLALCLLGCCWLQLDGLCPNDSTVGAVLCSSRQSGGSGFASEELQSGWTALCCLWGAAYSYKNAGNCR